MTLRKILEEVASGEIDVENAVKQIRHEQNRNYSNKITAEQLEEMKVRLETYVNPEFFTELDEFEEITYSELKALVANHLSEEYLKAVAELGLEIDREMGAKFAIHDVNLEYISGLMALEIEGYDAQTVVKARIHGVEPEAIAVFRDAGVDGTLRQYIKMEIHGVTTDFASQLRELGYEKLGANDLVKLRIHDVTPEYITEVRSTGLNPSLNELRKMSIHGVTAEYIAELRDQGLEDLDARELIKSSIHGLDGERVKVYRSLFEEISLRDMTKLSIHGIDIEFIEEMAEAGLTGIKPRELIKLSNHGIRGTWIQEFSEHGFEDMGVRDYIQARSHGVNADFLGEMKEAGMEDLSLRELIQFRSHGVYPGFVKKVYEIGYRPTARQLIQLQIHGVSVAELAQGYMENMDINQVISQAIHR